MKIMESEVEEKELLELNRWMTEQNPTTGIMFYDLADLYNGEQWAIFNLA
jgi:hypothetical protein